MSWLGLPTQTVTIRRAVGDWTDRGTWETTSWDTFTVEASVQPVSGEYAQQFPDAIREQIRYVLFLPSNQAILHVARAGERPADRVLLDTPDEDETEFVVLDRVGWQSSIGGVAHIRYALGEVP